ncbi:MAG: hypothetical protein PVI86_19405 [Phycisphaerae bacterium]
MTANPMNSPLQPQPPGHRQSLPRRIAVGVAEWSRAVIVVIVWAIALAIALGAAYMAIVAVVCFIDWASKALGLGA